MQFPQSLRPERRQNGRISTIEVHHLKCFEGNCMRNFSPADERRPQGLRTRLRTLPVRASSSSPAALPRKNSPNTGLSVAHPRKSSPGTRLPVALPRKSSPNTGLPVVLPRKNSPGTGLPVALPRKNSPSTPENSIFRPFWACRANFFALTPIPGRAGRTFSRRARDDGATLKPPTPLQGRNGPKMAFHRSQRRWRFHSAARKC